MSYSVRPYQDESLYSLVARQQGHTLERKSKLNRKLSISQNSSIHPFLPRGISRILKTIGPIETEEEILSKYTPFAFYSKFLNKKQNKVLKKFFLYGGSSPIIPGRNWKTCLRFCPKCLDIDIKTIGESYWRNQHQMPFAKICLEHNLLLQEFHLPIEKTIRSEYYSPSLLNKDEEAFKLITNPNINHQIIVKRVNEIANDNNSFCKDSLRKLAEEKRLFDSSKSRIFVNPIIKKQFLLFIADLGLRENIGPIYFGISLFKRSSNEAFLCVLLEIFLNQFHPPENKEPDIRFARCINPLCSSFQNSFQYTFKVKKGRKTQWVKCPDCELVYLGPLIDQNQHPHITDYGRVIHLTVRKMRDKFSNIEIARQLNIYKLTSKKVSQIVSSTRSVRVSKKIDKEQRRRQWIDELTAPGFVNIGVSSLKLKTVFGYLRKTDGKWMLQANSAFRGKKVCSRKKSYKGEEDNFYFNQLQDFIIEFKRCYRNTRLSKHLMLRSIDVSLSELVKRYPRTFQLLKSNEENQFNYSERYIQNYIRSRRNTGAFISKGVINDKFHSMKRFSEHQRQQIYSLLDQK